MGTRSLTIIRDENEEEIVVMYRQYDGYPEGHGKELVDFLKDFTVVNGFTGSEPAPAANGVGCLAAQLIKHFKKEIGNIYLYPANTRDCGEDYRYTISVSVDNLIHLEIWSVYSQKGPKVLYSGNVKDVDINSLTWPYMTVKE